LHALLAARLDAVGAANKLAFQQLAVIGAGASEAQLSAVGGRASVEALSGLVELGLVRMEPDGSFSPADPLLHEVAYETLPRTSRGELHKRAAEAASRPEDRGRHLEAAARYLQDDESLAAEASDALVQVGLEFWESGRFPEARRLLERAVSLGCRDFGPLLKLADIQSLEGDSDAALETLQLMPDDPSDPSVALERDHAMGRAQMFSNAAAAIPRLHDVARRWGETGNKGKEAWALANSGAASFNLSQMEEASVDLERAVALFKETGDRAGEVAAASFLSLVRPTDPRVATWLASALTFAEASGDRMRQMSALTPLAWHHGLRTMWGPAGESAEAEKFAARLAAVAEDLGQKESAIHGHSLLSILARSSGRIDEAARHAEAVSRLSDGQDSRDPWLPWAVGFSVMVARGTSTAAAPFPPADYTNPVGAVAVEVIQAELVFAGRIEEALGHGATGLLERGPVADTSRVLRALMLVLAGRPSEALQPAERAETVATQMGARPVALMARAIQAEVKGDPSLLPPLPDDPISASGAVVLRAHAVLGDAEAASELHRVADLMSMRGLLAGCPGD
jgi:tetratricopeptide (TPR) repeat protein